MYNTCIHPIYAGNSFTYNLYTCILMLICVGDYVKYVLQLEVFKCPVVQHRLTFKHIVRCAC